MITNKYPLWADGEYYYPFAFGFIPNIVSYIHDEDHINRPVIVIVPGGAYCAVSLCGG